MNPAVSVAGGTAAMVDMLGTMRDAGITHVSLDPVAPGGVEGRLDAVRQFMEDVAPQMG